MKMFHGLQRLEIDSKFLSKKYKTDVKRVVSSMKSGFTDFEISRRLGIDICQLAQLRYDIELAHQRHKIGYPYNNSSFRIY
jgi:hypothetical protein